MHKRENRTDVAVGCLILLITVPLGAVWSGYVLSVLWSWFIVTTFEARPLSIPAAIGMALVAHYLTHQIDRYTDKSKSQLERIIESTGYIVLQPLFALVIGWIVYQFL